MSNPFSQLAELAAATVAVRRRTGKQSISTRVKAGQFQVVDVTFPKGRKGRSEVVELSAWMSLSETVSHLNAIQLIGVD
jgi:hypothetical protein